MLGLMAMVSAPISRKVALGVLGVRDVVSIHAASAERFCR